MEPEMYDYDYDYAYADPYAYDYDTYEEYSMYGNPEVDWTSYEYSDPYGESYSQDDTGCDQDESFDPGYYYE